jgi:hypothetical protein
MNLETQKIELAKMVLDTEDLSLLQQIKELFEEHEELTWDKLPEHVKEGIKRAEKEIENGQVHTYEEMKTHISKLLK